MEQSLEKTYEVLDKAANYLHEQNERQFKSLMNFLDETEKIGLEKARKILDKK